MKRLLTVVLAIAMAVVPTAGVAHAADETPPQLSAVGVQLVASDTGSVYQKYADRYVIGPDGWVEWKITVKEKLAGFESGMYFDFDTEVQSSSGIIGDHKTGLLDRMEGTNTLVLRFKPDAYDKSGYVTPDRMLRLNYGSIRFYATNKETGQEEIKKAYIIDMNSIKGMPRVYFKREYPTIKLSPTPDDLRRANNNLPNGLSADRLTIDISDPILDPGDFEFKYDLQAYPPDGSNNKKTDWTVMQERNFIDVPPQARNKSVNLTVEVRDRGGNTRPYVFYYPGKGDAGVSRVVVNPFDILDVAPEHENGFIYLDHVNDKNDPFWAFQLPELFQQAKNGFRQMQQHYSGPNVSFPPVAVFMYSTPQKSMAPYTGKDDVDMTRSGYTWSKTMDTPGPDAVVTPFKSYYMAQEKNPYNGKTYEGYWGVVEPDASMKLTSDGEYYLFVKVGDARTGGFTWQMITYSAERLLKGASSVTVEPVTYIRDTTPLDINLSPPKFDKDNYDITITVNDNAKLRAAQYKISTSASCLTAPASCTEPWVDIPLSADGKIAARTLNTANLLTDLKGSFKFYVYARAVEDRFKEDGWYITSPFDDKNKDHIVTSSREHYIKRSQWDAGFGYKLSVFASYFDELTAASPEHRIRLYAQAEGDVAAEGDLFYKIETASGTTVKDWSKVGSGEEIVLNGANGNYKLRAYANGLDGQKRSNDFEINYIINKTAPAPFMTAQFSATEPVNNNVIVTVQSSTPVKLDGSPNYLTTYTLTYANNGTYSLNYETNGGQTGTVYLSIGNIDKNGFNYWRNSPLIVYSPSSPTAGEVTAFLLVGKRVLPNMDGITYQNGWLSHTFNANGAYTFDAADLAGNRLSDYLDVSGRTAAVNWIETDAPAATISYSTTAPTNKPVTATINVPPGNTVANNGGSPTYTFTDNGTFTFHVRTSKGTVFPFTAQVSNIDKTPPVITLNGPLTYPVYQGLPFRFVEPGYTATDNVSGDVTGLVQVTNKVDVYKGGYYEIVYTVTDAAGNTAREVRGVTVMDLNGINLFVNGIKVKGDVKVPKGRLDFVILGQESDEQVFKYLPGQHTAGEFKDQGIRIEGNTLTLNQEGWYTFYVQDRERKTFVGQVYVQ